MKAFLLLVSTVFFLEVTICFAQDRSGLIPDFVGAQYAGSIGYASIGVGYDLHKSVRGSLHYGYLPEKQGGDLHILSAKFVFTPVVLKLNEKFQVRPIDFGFMPTYHFGEHFHNRWPSRYPDQYYWWTSALRFHLLTESSLTYVLPNSHSFIRAITGYIEFNTNDLYLVSFAQNVKAINVFDIVKAGVGIRLKF